MNKVDRKGRVSVPAQFRAALSQDSYQGIIAYPSLADSAVDAFSRTMLEELNQHRLDKTMADGQFEQALLGNNSMIETIMAMAHELPFDSEGRIVLPTLLAEAAGIKDRAAFVGRGTRFQIWEPKTFEQHQNNAVTDLRSRLRADGNST